jgi:chromosome segregation ATPase
MADNVDNTLLQNLLLDIRKELGEQRGLLLQSLELDRRRYRDIDDRVLAIDRRIAGVDERISGLDARIANLKDELEMMIKSELMGALANLETRIEHMFDERLARIRP